MDYRPIDTAPESKTMRVVWGLGKERPEYGEARRLGDSWFKLILMQTVVHAQPLMVGFQRTKENGQTLKENNVID